MAHLPFLPPERKLRTSGEAWLEANIRRARTVGIFAEVFDIDVDRAQALLARNPHNRSIVGSAVSEWAQTIRQGRWTVNGETIIVADTGELNDGQHRLLAVVETGIPIQSLVVFGVPRESRTTVDCGQKRTAAHVLGMSGVPNSSLVAATIKILMNLDEGVAISTHRNAQVIKNALPRYPNLDRSFAPGRRVGTQFRQSTAMCCALHYLFAQRDEELANAFFSTLADGTAPTKTHPTALLRTRLIENLAGKAKLPMHEVAALFIKAWNAYRCGESLRYLRWRTAGDKPEDFPQVL
jgi:hypothetical protein